MAYANVSNVRELRELLHTLDGDMKIIMSKDAEGNRFKFAYCAETSLYDEEELNPLDPDDAEDDAPEALFLWPV